jgi:4'-phosphopantetheinyl transferase EntD
MLTNPASLSAPIAQLFSARVSAADLHGPGDLGLLDPGEAACCARFSAKRIAEFSAGRLCARRALAELGVTRFALATNADRTPAWPPGIVGSISHTDGYCCAVVAQIAAVRSIGVDVERLGRVEPEIDRLIFTAGEMAFLATLNDADRHRAATIIFSAKEAFYKCQYPLTRRWLDFTDVSLELPATHRGSGAFRVAMADPTFDLGNAISFPLEGKFRIDGRLVITGVTLGHGLRGP